jgi:hypothetical protein
VLIFPLKLCWAMLFCQSLAGSIFVVGWTYRLAQRSAFKTWNARARSLKSGTGGSAGAGGGLIGEHAHWPNWFVRQNFRQGLWGEAARGGSYAAKVLRLLFHSLWTNFWIGLRGIANTWVLTLPACLLWWFGWYDGWNNSFNKGYEQAPVGPLISLLGVGWFIAVMFYLPLAQARQAVTGEWRCFYQWKLIRKLVREQWLYCVLLAVLYSLLSVPLAALKTSPMFWMHNRPELGNLSREQVVAMLNGYFFWSAIVVVPAFVMLRVAAARIYASGIIALVRSGKIGESELAPTEREALSRLGLLGLGAEPPRHRLVRFITWTGTRVGRVVGGIVLALVWFSFVAQIYISEFLNYHGGRGWMNQPLVQLPWFHYVPSSIRNPLGAVSSALLVLLAACLVRSVARNLRRLGRAP